MEAFYAMMRRYSWYYLFVVALLRTTSDTSLTSAAIQLFAPTFAPLARRRLPTEAEGSDASLRGAPGGISIDRPGLEKLAPPWGKGRELE